jgi:ADP-ribose pyrophosphatase
LETQVSSKRIYAGRIVSLRVDQVETPGGRRTTREVVERPDTVSVLAIDEENRALLVRQFRYVVGADSLEIPAGTIDAGESPAEAARRELREETGHDCDILEELVSYHPAIGYCSERMTVFLARRLRRSPLRGDEEDIRVERVAFEDVYISVAEGRPPFQDAKSSMAVLLARARGKA